MAEGAVPRQLGATTRSLGVLASPPGSRTPLGLRRMPGLSST